jgi:hypothetical protein
MTTSAIARRLEGGADNGCRGVIVADEVGMGKTRVATAVADAVTASGGRMAILIPPGLDYQWRRELAADDIVPPDLVRSLGRYCGTRPERPTPWRPWR